MNSSTNEQTIGRGIHRMHPSEDGSRALSEETLSMTSCTHEKNTALRMPVATSDMIGAITSRLSRKPVRDGTSAYIRIAILILVTGLCSASNQKAPWLKMKRKPRRSGGGASLEALLKKDEQRNSVFKCQIGVDFKQKKKEAYAKMTDEEKDERFKEQIIGGLKKGRATKTDIPSSYKGKSETSKEFDTDEKTAPEILKLERVKEIFLNVITEYIHVNKCIAKPDVANRALRHGDIGYNEFWDGVRKFDQINFSTNFREFLADPEEWNALITDISNTPKNGFFKHLLKDSPTWMDFRRVKRKILDPSDAIRLFNEMEVRRKEKPTTKTDQVLEAALKCLHSGQWSQEEFDAWMNKHEPKSKKDLKQCMEDSMKSKAKVLKSATTIQEIIERAIMAKSDPDLYQRHKHPSFSLKDQLIVKRKWKEIISLTEQQKNDPIVLSQLRKQYEAEAKALVQKGKDDMDSRVTEGLLKHDRKYGTQHAKAHAPRTPGNKL